MQRFQASEKVTRPMYEDHHESCSVLAGRIRNAHRLQHLSPPEQFRFHHDFYLLLDRIVDQHQVYKLHGGAHSFMISTAVAEPDPHHAATLLRFALHLHYEAQKMALPGLPGVHVELGLALASSPASSGLLGSLSLTYQVVGRCVHEAQELLETQEAIPFLISGSMVQELPCAAADGLVQLGSLPLRALGTAGEEVTVYSMPRYSHHALLRIPQPAHSGNGVVVADGSHTSGAAREVQPGQRNSIQAGH